MIDEKYELLCKTPSDIHEHLPTLKKYASESPFIVELGVRGIVSTWALLAGKPKQMLSVDIAHPKEFGADIMEVYDATADADIAYAFVEKSSLDIVLPEHDLLFIDTLHTYDQLTAELNKHENKVRTYILMHDTNLKGDPDNMRGAVNDFIDKNSQWEIKEFFENCNGLTVLKRV